MFEFENYYESEKLEELISGRKSEIEKCLKEEAKELVEQARQQLQDFKEKEKELQDREYALERKECALERKVSDFEQDIEKEKQRLWKEEKFAELVKKAMALTECYEVEAEYKEQEKCNKCDKDRKISYKSKDGEEIFRNCECKDLKKFYSVKKVEIYKFSIQKHKHSNKKRDCLMFIRFENQDYSRDYTSFARVNIIDKFDSEGECNEYYYKYYSSEEEAQKHVKWLNENKDC